MVARLWALVDRAWSARHDRLWPLAVAFGATATVLVLANQPDAWAADNRFEQYVNPGRRLTRMFSIWDPSRGFGTVRTEWWPGATIPLALIRGLGASPELTQHLWHALLMTLGGVGAVAFLRQFVPRIGIAHVVTGGLYMFGPYSVGFLLPSNLFLNYALAPWLFLAFLLGLRHPRPWRSAAAITLLVFAVGTTEITGLLYAFAYLVPIAAYTIHVERDARWSSVWRLAWRTAALGSATLAAMAVAVVVGGEGYEQNLRETESPDVLNGVSSWAESWRGLGSWLLYHRDQTGSARPQIEIYLSSAVTILATFAAPVLAIAAVALSRRRIRILAGAMMAMGLTFMVGLYPLDDPSPYGRLLDAAYDRVGALRVLRNNYKAGSGAVWATSALAGLAVAGIVARIGAWRRSRLEASGRDPLSAAAVGGAAVVALVVVGAATQPFWRTGIYDPARSVVEVPDHVTDAMAFVDSLEPDGRVLFLPRAYRSGFRWGHVNDDVLDTYLGRANLVEVPIHVSRPVTADILTAVDRSLIDRHIRPGNVGAYARRLGISHVVIRNDFDWATWSQPRPSEFSSLRDDPSLELVATFGEPGAFTTSRQDQSLESGPERRLAPIEVYRVVDPGPTVRLVPPTGDLLVSGDGEAWPLLAETGLLDGAAPLRYTAAVDASTLAASLEAGSVLVITDTNRRQVEVITVTGERSATLPEDGELDRPPYRLWSTPGAETLATYGDATTISSEGQVAFTAGLQPWHRAAMATDGDPATTWLVGGLADPRGERIRIELADEHRVGTVELTAAPPASPGDRRLAAVIVRLDDGTERRAGFDEERIATVDLAGAATRSIEIVVSGIAGSGGGPVGLAEIDVEGLDLRERIVLPDDVARRAESDAALAAALADAPIAYGFQRLVGDGLEDEERALRRTFTAIADTELVGTGRLQLARDVPESLLAALAGANVRAVASERLNDEVGFAGVFAVDGRTRTGWLTEPEPGAVLTLGFERQLVDRIDVLVRVGEGLARPTRLRVRDADGLDVAVDVEARDCGSVRQCTQRVVIDLPPARRNGLELVVDEVREVDLDSLRPVRIDEVFVGDIENEIVDERPVDATCFDDLLVIDGVSVPIRLDGTSADAIDGEDLTFTTCDTVTLVAGEHRLDSGDGVLLDTLLLAPAATVGAPPAGSGEPAEAVAGQAAVSSAGQTRFAVEVEAPDGGRLVLTQSWHPAWRASLDGRDLGEPVELDGFAAWEIPPGSAGVVEIEFTWQRVFDLALVLTGAGVAVCTWLLLRREPER